MKNKQCIWLQLYAAALTGFCYKSTGMLLPREVAMDARKAADAAMEALPDDIKEALS